MLGFPTPYPNEVLYSLIARAGVHDGEVSPKQLLDSVFANRKVIATVDLPSHVQCIADQYPEPLGLDLTKLIRNHTLWPIYAPFVPRERGVVIEGWMCGDSNGAAHLATGVAASRIQSKQKLLLCQACVAEQKRINGEAFWDRRWQVPVVRCCPRHDLLTETNVDLSGAHRHAFVPISEAYEVGQLYVTDSDYRFSNLVYDLFDSLAYEPPCYQQWTLFYRSLAIKYGYLVGRRIDHQEIYHQYCSYWGNDWLKRGNLLPSNLDTSWLKSIFRKHRKSFSFAEHLTVVDAISQGEALITDVIKLALSHTIRQKELKTKVETVPEEESQDQKNWVDILRTNNPKIARTQQPALYARLYRNNYQWLMQVNDAYHCVAASVNNRVNWEHRDRESARALLILCDQIDEDLSVPRMSKTYLLHHLANSVTIEKNLHRLPRCRTILDKYAESIEEYQARRLARAYILMRERGQNVKKWSLLRESGLSEERMTDIIKSLLKEILKDEVGCEI